MVASSILLHFLVAVLLLTTLLSLVVITPWLLLGRARSFSRPDVAESASVAISLMDLNVSVFRERLCELAADFASGQLSPDDYAGLKADLERQLLAAAAAQPGTQFEQAQSPAPVRRPPWGVVLLVFFWLPVLAGMVYVWQIDHAQSAGQSESGKSTDYRALWAYWAAQQQYGGVVDQLMSGQLSTPPDDALQHALALLQTMQAHVYRHPLDAARWAVLAEGYRAADMTPAALAALAHAHRLAPDDPGISMRYAQMRFTAQAGKIDAETDEVLRQVLRVSPQHEGALMLLALASYRDQQYDAAVVWLQRLKAARIARANGQPVAPTLLAQLDQTIAKAEQAMQQQSESKNAQPAVKSSNNRALNAHQSLSITVQLASALQGRVNPADTVFVYARALKGMSAPYAVRRAPASVLLTQFSQHQPWVVTLTDDDHMLPERTLSQAYASNTPLVVAARISRHGDPLPQSGDLEALPVPVGQTETSDGYRLTIDQIHP